MLRGGGRDENGKEGGGNEEGGVVSSAHAEELIARALEHRGRAAIGTDCDMGDGHGDSKEMGRLEDMLEQDLLEGDAAVAAAAHMEDNDSTWAHTLGVATSLAASTTSTQLPPSQVDAPPVLQAGTEHARTAAQVQAHVDAADVPAAKTSTTEGGPPHNALRLDLLRHADARDPRPRQRDLQDDPAYILEPLLRQWVVILFKDGTNMAGVLQHVDRNSNIIISNATERVFPDFVIQESVEELSAPLHYDPRVAFQDDIVQKAGLYSADEMLLDHPGVIIMRGDAVAMILSVDQADDAWRSNPFPRFFAYASARTAQRERLLKHAGLHRHRPFIDPEAR